jgi:hypothetical protein
MIPGVWLGRLVSGLLLPPDRNLDPDPDLDPEEEQEQDQQDEHDSQHRIPVTRYPITITSTSTIAGRKAPVPCRHTRIGV